MISNENQNCTLCGKSLSEAPAPVTPEPAKPAPPAPPPMPAAPEVPAPPPGKDPREEFSDLVNEVRPMLTLAKDSSIDTTTPRRLIDKAVALGKRREVEAAVSTMRECRELLLRSIADRVERDIMYLENLAEVARKMKSDYAPVQKIIGEAKAKKAAGDLEGALAEARNGRKLAEQLTGRYVEAHELYESLEKLVINAERFYLDVREARKLLNEAMDAGENGDWSTMGILSRKGREELLKALPDVLMAELRKAKQALLDAKAKGRDVTVLVKILRDAGVSLKREQYQEALEHLTEFWAEEKNL